MEVFYFFAAADFIFHRAAFFSELGREDEAKRLFALFLKQQAAFRPDALEKILLDYDGFDIQEAIAIAKDGL